MIIGQDSRAFLYYLIYSSLGKNSWLKIIKNHSSEKPEKAIDLWTTSKCSDIERIKRVVDDLKAAGAIHIDKLYFANRQIRALLA